MPVELKAEGLEAMQETLKNLEKLSATVKGVEFRGFPRDDGTETNEEIIEHLVDDQRDFFSLPDGDDDTAAIVEAFEKEVQRRLDRATAKGKPLDNKAADNAARGGFSKAMQKYAEVVVARIEAGRVAGGGRPKALSPKYAEEKEIQWGFAYPVGKASEQLMDNLKDKTGIKIVK